MHTGTLSSTVPEHFYVYRNTFMHTGTLFLKCSGIHIHTEHFSLNCSDMYVKSRYDYDTCPWDLVAKIHLCMVDKDTAYV
jgi:hypothetical protein